MRTSIALAACAACLSVPPAAQATGAEALVCELVSLCEDGECRPLGVAMDAGIGDDTAWIGPSEDDRLVLSEIPGDFPGQRLFAASDGPDGDAIVFALRADGRLVMFQSPARADIRFAAIVGDCREAG